MRAISSFSLDAGISTRECLAPTALRIRANMSATGSVMLYSKSLPIFDCRFSIVLLQIGNRQLAIENPFSPARFHHAGNLPLQGQLTKTDAAQVKLSQIAARAAASQTARIAARRKLRLATRFGD